MKLLLTVALALVIAVNATPGNQVFEQAWKAFKAEYNRVYASAQEESRRHQIFVDNFKAIQANNDQFAKGKISFEMGVNEYTDLTDDEISNMMGFEENENAENDENFGNLRAASPAAATALPDSIDWREKGYVTEVKNQNPCGCCWAFGGVGAIEGQHFKKTGELVSLSEQHMLDCAYGDWNGCRGGNKLKVLQYTMKNNGIATTAAYPYEKKKNACRFQDGTVGATVAGIVKLPGGNETALKEALATIGPIAVSMDAKYREFSSYKSGILDVPNRKKLNHAVLAVGYGSENGMDYWIIKNSWGKSWGEQGYLRVARNKNNVCGIASTPIYPIV